jgi:hypothetical protein
MPVQMIRSYQPIIWGMRRSSEPPLDLASCAHDLIHLELIDRYPPIRLQ